MEGAEREPAEVERPSLSAGKGPAHNWRILFAAVWIAVQLALILTAGRRHDFAFGFRMFPESSTIQLSLYREVEGPTGRERIHIQDGVWGAKSVDGRVHRFSWYDRVPLPFWPFDREVNASYGAQVQLTRLQAAVEDVAAHVPDDAETLRLMLDVTVRRNGREPVVHHIISRDRITTTRDEVH